MTENLPDTNVGNIGYIRRENLIDAFGLSEKTRKYGGDHSAYDTRMLYEIQDTIESIEPADVVQVVRCKDCGWAMKSTELPGWYMCKCEEAFDHYAKPDDFCSYGEREE